MYIHINDNYCVTKPVVENRLLGGVAETLKTLKTNVNYCVVSPVPFATRNVRQPQKKGLSPPLKEPVEIKSVNSVSSVVQCVSAQSVPNVHSVVHAPLVGGCLQPFWQVWARLGANPKVVSILKEGYVLPFNLKMETPETIRISLQQGEWVTSLDFSDAYFHIPVHTGSRKYLRFHFQNLSYQFRSLPFGLSTAPMEFTGVVKEVKLMAQTRGIRIHQYLDDWLIQAPTRESCHQGTQSLLALCQELGWVVNLQKSELEPKQIFEFIGYKYDLSQGLVLPTQNHWETILKKLKSILSKPSCRVRKFMSLIGLLTATEKQVPLGRLHMRPIQWHLKRHWRVPESLEKEIPVPRSLHPHLLWWTKETAFTSFESCRSNLYRRLERRLGCSLR